MYEIHSVFLIKREKKKIHDLWILFMDLDSQTAVSFQLNLIVVFFFTDSVHLIFCSTSFPPKALNIDHLNSFLHCSQTLYLLPINCS